MGLPVPLARAPQGPTGQPPNSRLRLPERAIALLKSSGRPQNLRHLVGRLLFTAGPTFWTTGAWTAQLPARQDPWHGSRSGLREVRPPPYLLIPVGLHFGNVALRRRGVPAPREPASKAPRGIARPVLPAPVNRVEPAFVPLEA